MLVILEYGIGNINSISNMLRKIGVQSTVTNDPVLIGKADKIILPGVGHFDYCMKQIRKQDFFPILQSKVCEDRTSILGVCVGCQMLFQGSEEGTEPGLGWLKGKVVKFDNTRLTSKQKIPHMSWSDVSVKTQSPLYLGLADPRFYFVHSFHVHPDNYSIVSAECNYGYDFPASVEDNNIFGVQFHPEKSHHFGMTLYRNFVNLA